MASNESLGIRRFDISLTFDLSLFSSHSQAESRHNAVRDEFPSHSEDADEGVKMFISV